MKIALGTAQFGLKYGVANRKGRVCLDECEKILNEASLFGIDTLDTAIAYGDSEARLGALGVQGWKVVTKLPALPNSVHNVEVWVFQQVFNSLDRLGISRLDGLLLHRPADILGPYGVDYVRALKKISDEGLSGSIGYSIYSPDELGPLLRAFTPCIVQAPFNVVDRRILKSGWLARLAEDGVRVHTRSVFLQGLLLMSAVERPAQFVRWQPLWQQLSRACDQSGLTPLQLALGYVLAHSSIERVVVGVDSLFQLTQILSAASVSCISADPETESHDLELLDPSRWRFL